MTPQRFIIYCHTNKVNGKKYVGQTRYALEHRWSGHVHAALKRLEKSAFCNAIRKYGPDAFEHEVLDVVSTRDGANIAERAWIQHWGCRAPDGYNLAVGGRAASPHAETRQKISASWQDPTKKALRVDRIHKAWANPDLRRRMSKAAKERMAAMTPEARAALNLKISERVKGGLPPIDDEWRRVRGEGSKAAWAKRTQEERARIVAPMRAACEAQTPEKRRETVRKMNAAHARRTPEERRALALKAWATKRARYGDTPGLYLRRCRACGRFGHYSTSCARREDS